MSHYFEIDHTDTNGQLPNILLRHAFNLLPLLSDYSCCLKKFLLQLVLCFLEPHSVVRKTSASLWLHTCHKLITSPFKHINFPKNRNLIPKSSSATFLEQNTSCAVNSRRFHSRCPTFTCSLKHLVGINAAYSNFEYAKIM